MENAVTPMTSDLAIQPGCVDSIMSNHWLSTRTVFFSGTPVNWMFMKDVTHLVCISHDLYIHSHIGLVVVRLLKNFHVENLPVSISQHEKIMLLKMLIYV